MGKIKVMLVDKRELFRVGLAKILEANPNIEVVGTYSSGLEGAEKASMLKPDIVLLDTEDAVIPKCAYVEPIRRLRELLPETQTIILTHSIKDCDLFSALKAGAKAYITKDVEVEDLVSTIVRVYRGEVIISPPMAAKLLEEFAQLERRKEAVPEKHDAGLSPRETEVLAWVAKGATNREIASTLFISEYTVKVHLSRILEKLHVRNRQQAAALAIEKGIVSIVSKVSRSDT